MVGKIVFDGYCKDCDVSDLSIQQLYSGSGVRVTNLICSHENACRRMKIKSAREQKEEDKNAL